MERCDSSSAVRARQQGLGRRRFLGRMIAAGASLAAAGAVPRLAAQSRFLTAATLDDGFELYYEVHGEGPVVVFAHGAGGTHLSWWQQIPAMSEHFECVTFDHRGFGYSRDVPSGPGRAAFVDDLHGLLEHLGIGRVALVGQSMGGWTTLGFASAWPERVSALVLCDTPGGYTDPEVARLMQRRPAERGAFAPSFGEREPELAFLYREIQRSTLDRTPGGGPRAASGLLSASTDIGPIVAHQIPTLFVVGEEDSIFPPAALEAMHRKMPGSEFALVPGAGHSVYYEKPALFNRLVIEFLRRHASAARG
ncbi:MAG: alpha/beta fold hydrolase [Acidobacteria bacterium]|nr:alpha/beta fold hydrolase [Acidobacteriota bacterium]